MLVQASVRHTAQSAVAAPALLILFSLATQLSVPPGGNNSTAASSFEALPRLLLGACDRSLIGGALWRLRNHPVSEVIVAKSSLLTHGDVYSVPRIAELGSHVGVGFQNLLNWLETLTEPQQVYAWKLFAGAEATQAFLSKFQGAEQLYEEGTGPRVLQRLKFVLNDGKVDLPATTGVERLLSEAMAAYKAAFFVFAGELCDAIARTDIVAFDKKLQDYLPLLKEILAGLLALCVRLDDNVTKEYRTTLGRWLLKLFRLDSAALSLSPFSPADQVLHRKLVLDMGIEGLGGTTQVGADGGSNCGTSQANLPGTPPAEDPRFAHQATSTMQSTQGQHQDSTWSQFSSVAAFSAKPEQGLQPATGTPPSMMSSAAVMTAGANGFGSLQPASPPTFFDLARQQASQGSPPTSPTYAVAANLSTIPGVATAALASALGGDIKQATGSTLPARVPPSEGSLTPSFVPAIDRSTSSVQVHEGSSTRPAGTAERAPGVDTLTSMAALLRAEAAHKNYASGSLTPDRSPSTVTAAAQSTGIQDKYYLGGYTLDNALRRTTAVGRTMSDGSRSGGGTVQDTSTKTGSGWASSTADTVRAVDGEAQNRGQIERRGDSTAGKGAPASSGYTMHYMVKLTEQDKPRGQETVRDKSQLTTFRGERGGSSAGSSQEVNVLRAGSPLSAGELQTRLRTMDKLMQTSKPSGDSEAAAGASLQGREVAAQRQTGVRTLNTSAPPTTSPKAGELQTRLRTMDKLMQTSKPSGDLEAAAGASLQGREVAAQRQTGVRTLNTSAPPTTSPKAALHTQAAANTIGFPRNTTDAGQKKVTFATTATQQKGLPILAAGGGWGTAESPEISPSGVTLPTAAGGAHPRTVATTTAAGAMGSLTRRETGDGLRTGLSSATAAGRRALETSKPAGGWRTRASPAEEEAFSTTATMGGRKTLTPSAAAAGNEISPTGTGTAGRGKLGASAAAAEPGKLSPSAIATEERERRTAAPAAGQRTPPPSAGRTGGEPVVTATVALGQRTQRPTGPAGNEVSPPAAGAGENGTVPQRRSPPKVGMLAALFARALGEGTRGTPPDSGTATEREAMASLAAAERSGTPASSPTSGVQRAFSSRVAPGDEKVLTVADALKSEAQLWSSFDNKGKPAATVRSPATRERHQLGRTLSPSVGAEKEEKVASLKTTAARETSTTSTGYNKEHITGRPT